MLVFELHTVSSVLASPFKQGGPPFLSFGLDLDRLGKMDTAYVDRSEAILILYFEKHS